MQKWDKKYPHVRYGAMFSGWLYESMDITRETAKIKVEVTHNHLEGIKGAKAIASAIFLTRNGSIKHEIEDYVKTGV